MPAFFLSLAFISGLPQAQNAAPDPVEARASQLRAELPRNFTVVVERPFVVIGDESPERVRSRAVNTVRWAVDHLRQEYFPKDPDKVIDIWLFRDAESYRANAKKYFDDEPSTSYGYYSPPHHALIMNISTGGGTLVHEIVHPLVEANFPNCPAWFNEGLGSLYEQSTERDGRIVGLTNWRLPQLQETIRRGELQGLDELMTTNELLFYDDDTGTNYAQARYLLMYLQERGVLKEFYTLFKKNYRRDLSGIRALKSVLGVKSLSRIEKEWKSWVLGLRFKG